MTEEAGQAAPTCPPHRWFIEAQNGPQGGTETWTCTQCNEVQTVVRGHNDAPKPPWTVGKATAGPPPAKPNDDEANED